MSNISLINKQVICPAVGVKIDQYTIPSNRIESISRLIRNPSLWVSNTAHKNRSNKQTELHFAFGILLKLNFILRLHLIRQSLQ